MCLYVLLKYPIVRDKRDYIKGYAVYNAGEFSTSVRVTAFPLHRENYTGIYE